MKTILTKGKIALLIIFAVLIIDQVLKIWIKTHMFWHESIRITDWFYIYFTENNGMAFGMEIFGKLFLSLFRIVAVFFLGWYIYRSVKNKLKTGYIVCFALIFSGALGNVLDCIFYGEIFTASTTPQIAPFVPFGQRSARWFHGRVVALFSFPFTDTNCPECLPFVRGSPFIFFSPIFNFADAAISCGIIALLLFYSKYLNDISHLHSKTKDQAK